MARIIQGRTVAVALCAVAIALGIWVFDDIRRARLATPQIFAAAQVRFGTVIDPEMLPPEWMHALLLVEDPLFYDHRGIDLETPGAGMTSITQALVKFLYFPEGFEPGILKLRQSLLARYALDAGVSKDDQMRLFLNAAYFGTKDGVAIRGFGQAAQAWFDKPFGQLSRDEFLMLVGMLAGPDAMSPDTSAGQERFERVKDYLAGHLEPASVYDVFYTGHQGSTAQKAMAGLIRLITLS